MSANYCRICIQENSTWLLTSYNNIKAKDGKIKHSPKPICCIYNQIKINTTISGLGTITIAIILVLFGSGKRF